MTVAIVSGQQRALAMASNDPSPAQVAEFFLKGYKSSTKSAYAEDLRQFFTFCAMLDTPIFEVRRNHVLDFIESLRYGGNGPATIKRKVCVIRNFYRFAVDEDYTDKNPVPSTDKALHLVSVSRKSQTLGPDHGEAAALLEAARKRSRRDYAIIRTLIHQGLRVSELVNLNVDDMRSQRGHRVFHLNRKGDVEQDQVVSPAAVSAIDAYLAGRREGPLFVNDAGERMTRYQIDYLVECVAAQAGVDKHLTPHSLRHACATMLLDAGKSIRDVQVFMGHAHSATTERYDLGRDIFDRSPAYALGL